MWGGEGVRSEAVNSCEFYIQRDGRGGKREGGFKIELFNQRCNFLTFYFIIMGGGRGQSFDNVIKIRMIFC